MGVLCGWPPTRRKADGKNPPCATSCSAITVTVTWNKPTQSTYLYAITGLLTDDVRLFFGILNPPPSFARQAKWTESDPFLYGPSITFCSTPLPQERDVIYEQLLFHIVHAKTLFRINKWMKVESNSYRITTGSSFAACPCHLRYHLTLNPLTLNFSTISMSISLRIFYKMLTFSCYFNLNLRRKPPTGKMEQVWFYICVDRHSWRSQPSVFAHCHRWFWFVVSFELPWVFILWNFLLPGSSDSLEILS